MNPSASDPIPAAGNERRLWLIFFSNGICPGILGWLMPPGWRHVCAAAWYPEQERWVYVNPARDRTYIIIARGEEFDPKFSWLMSNSTAILEFPSQGRRALSPPVFSCVGAIKGLLGLRSFAITPRGLYVALRLRGAREVAPVRCNEAAGEACSPS